MPRGRFLRGLTVKFTKMQGIGNDFVVVDCLTEALPEGRLADISRRVNDRKFGIGGDGLVLVLPSHEADFRMRMLNPDGSEAQMCGNGVRCFAKYVYERGHTQNATIAVETQAGVMRIRLQTEGSAVRSASVDMGQPRVRRSEIPMLGEDADKVVDEALDVAGERFRVTAVSMGNPHAAIFVDDAAAIDLPRLGRAIETHAAFPERTNVHFAQVLSRNEIVQRTWERGAGITLACGTGACSVLVAGALTGRTDRQATIHLPGGDLRVEWAADSHVIMTGPAETVFEGTIEL